MKRIFFLLIYLLLFSLDVLSQQKRDSLEIKPNDYPQTNKDGLQTQVYTFYKPALYAEFHSINGDNLNRILHVNGYPDFAYANIHWGISVGVKHGWFVGEIAYFPSSSETTHNERYDGKSSNDKLSFSFGYDLFSQNRMSLYPYVEVGVNWITYQAIEKTKDDFQNYLAGATREKSLAGLTYTVNFGIGFELRGRNVEMGTGFIAIGGKIGYSFSRPTQWYFQGVQDDYNLAGGHDIRFPFYISLFFGLGGYR